MSTVSPFQKNHTGRCSVSPVRSEEDMPETTRFQDVDRHSDATLHVGYLDTASALEAAVQWKRRSIDLLGLGPGDHALEIGCGNGDEARTMAERVAPTGHVTAVDLSEKMLGEARGRGTDGVSFVQMDAHDLRFPDQTFDGCRVERTLQHVEDPERVVREMARVLRVGRRMVLSEPDWETLLTSARDTSVSRRVAERWADSSTHRHGRIGRQVADLLSRAGLSVMAVEGGILTFSDFALADRLMNLTAAAALAQRDGVISALESEQWLADLADQGRRGALIVSACGYTALGEKTSAI